MISLAPCCPDCGAADPACIGRLPDSDWFAGKRLAHPLPGGHLYRCRECHLKFRYPIQTSTTYGTLYDNAETNTWQPNVVRPDWDLIIERIGAYAPLGGKVLDFGCYSGGLLSKLDKHYERFGVEVNSVAARVAEKAAHAQVWRSLRDIPINLKFDVIVAADVVEHVPDPSELLNLLASRLQKPGVILVTTGDANAAMWNAFGANWWYCFYPEHIAFISLDWAQRAPFKHTWSVLEYQRFRHGRLGVYRRLQNLALASIYGMAPRAYLRICRFLKRNLGRGDVTSVPGKGITQDHILLILQQRESR